MPSRKERERRLPRTLVYKLTALLLSSCLLILLICFPGSFSASALTYRNLDASHDTISRHRLDHIPKWKPTKVHYPAFSDAARDASAENVLVDISNSSVPYDRIATNSKLSHGTLLPPPVQRDRRMLFMINAYEFNATESYVINTLQTLTSWCERGEEVHVALYTTSHELASYVFDKKQRFFCHRLSSSLPIAVLEYEKNITINIAGMHRYLVADKIDAYDWFLYTEDDLALKHSHVHFLKKWTRLLSPKGTLPHLMRYEVAPVRPLGLRRDALLLDEYPLPLTLFLINITETEVAVRDLDLHDENDELDGRDDRSRKSAALQFSEEEERKRDESLALKNRYQGYVPSLLSHRRRRRRDRNSHEDVSKKLPRTDSFSLTKTFPDNNILPTSHSNKNGTAFIRVPNPYMAMWLLPRDMLLSHVRESRWLNEVNDCPNPDVRVHFATFWLLPHFAFAVPLSSLRRALIHHVSTRYADQGLAQVDADHRRQTSHPFFLHHFFNVDAWDLEGTLSECMKDDTGDGAHGISNDNGAAAAAAAASVRTDNTLFEYAATNERLDQKHPSSIALQSPRILHTSTCSSCLNVGGNMTISVVKREKGEPLEYKMDCLLPERKH